MTPLINHCSKALSNWRGDWDPQALGIRSPSDFLRAITTCTVFQIEEAEFDTTTARDAHPAYFESMEGFFLPAPACWFEYKVYDQQGVYQGVRSAMMAVEEPDGIFVVVVGQYPPAVGDPNGIGAGLAFQVLPELIESPEDWTGRILPVRVSDWFGDDEGKAATVINYFLELVKLVNMPVGVTMRRADPHAGTVRRVRAKLGAKTTLSPYNIVTLNGGHSDALSSPVEGTGHKRAFHFVRSFLRTRLGRPERVRSHWRGTDDGSQPVQKIYVRRPEARL